MYYFGKTLYYDVGGVWKKCASVKTPYTSYEYLNGTLNSIRVSLTVPTSPVIKIMKSSAKSIRVRVTGGAEGANGGYQIQYSTDPNFSSYKKKTVTGISSSLTGLKKGVKYYVRVRGIYRRDEYLAKYGKWSAVKKA